MELRELGWESYASAINPVFDEKLLPSRVIVQLRGKWVISNPDGERIAEVSGRFRHMARDESEYPVVGDWVLVKPAREWEVPVIQQVLPRRTKFSRNAPGRAVAEQVIAANLDLVFVVLGLDAELNTRKLERFLAVACESGAKPVVVLTKTDLCVNRVEALERGKAAAGDFPVLPVCAVTGDGLEELQPWLEPGDTVALLGPSGVGKSTLLNALAGDDLQVVQEVRTKDDKGRHTTTRRELFHLPSGAMVIDTPGMRELQLWEAEEGIEHAFGDILELAASCRFSNCGHESEPGCAVRRALEEERLAPERLESFQKLQREQASFEERHGARPDPEKKRYLKMVSKQLRAHYKMRPKDR